MTPDGVSRSGAGALEAVFHYHDATKHSFQGHARGPGFLDWATQPDPFRRYHGARLIPLERIPVTDAPLYDEAFVHGRITPAPVTRRSLSQLFYDSLAISAWKSTGTVSWALRVNPSSGNLHPTEAYLICGPIIDLHDTPMVCHYAPKEHLLEVRAEFDCGLWDRLWSDAAADTFLVGLTSIHWREAWKYGQRAYRYCQHDAGHAIGAISVAAAGLGWQAAILDDVGTDELAHLMGTFRDHDAEQEEPDVLMAVGPRVADVSEMHVPKEQILAFGSLDWKGNANHLSPSHVDWGMNDIAAQTRKPQCLHGRALPRPQAAPLTSSNLRDSRPVSLRQIIRRRRSAVAMDRATHITRDTFYQMLHKTVAGPGIVPFSTLPWTPHLHLAIFVHRVNDLPPGLYVLVRDPSQRAALEDALTNADHWRRPAGCPPHLELYSLIDADVTRAAQQVSCFQDIASDGCFSLGMIAEYEAPLTRHGPWLYPRLFWEAGLIGQVLYLEAEAAGIRSTGIGCYFDDPMHDVLGLHDHTYQDLYHFTIGGAVEDTRLTTLPAYPEE